MPIMLNSILRDANLPLPDVRLIRHKDNQAKKGCTPYELWRDRRHQFELYQSIQSVANRPKFAAPYWAVFVVNHRDETLFAGLYAAKYCGLLERDTPMPHSDEIALAGSYDVYDLKLLDILHDLSGKLFIEWGLGAIAWVQYADRSDKRVTELHKAFKEPEFPGYLNFIKHLSELESLPSSWISALKSSHGVYLLTCPRTKEQYVGSANGEDGFWGRWQNYIQTGHGGNQALMSRNPSDYQVTILEVAGTSATKEDIGKMEGRWQRKLRSMEMGLNRNLASSC